MADLLCVEYDALTNTTVERALTSEEVANLKTLQKETKAIETQEKAKAEARASALAKLETLGLTAEEIAAL